jgi:hypothetical protein
MSPTAHWRKNSNEVLQLNMSKNRDLLQLDAESIGTEQEQKVLKDCKKWNHDCCQRSNNEKIEGNTF